MPRLAKNGEQLGAAINIIRFANPWREAMQLQRGLFFGSFSRQPRRACCLLLPRREAIPVGQSTRERSFALHFRLLFRPLSSGSFVRRRTSYRWMKRARERALRLAQKASSQRSCETSRVECERKFCQDFSVTCTCTRTHGYRYTDKHTF